MAPIRSKPSVILSRNAESPVARELIRKDEDIRKNTAAHELTGDYLLDILDAETGELRSRTLLETAKGSFGMADAFTIGPWIVIFDTIGRVHVYEGSTRVLRGQAFGSAPVVNGPAALLSVDSGPGKLAVYDLATMRRRAEFTFAHEVSLKAFNTDGKRLFVLTANQVAYVIDMTAR